MFNYDIHFTFSLTDVFTSKINDAFSIALSARITREHTIYNVYENMFQAQSQTLI